MRRPALITAVLALCLTAAGATFAAAKGAAKHPSQQKLTIYAVTPKDGLAVLPGQTGAFSLGDRVALSDDLFTSKGGTKLGTDGGACTVTRVTNAATGSGVLLCLVTFSLPGGDIETQALNTLTNGGFSGTQAGSITGGTGRYRHASGQLSIRFLSPTEAKITFQF
jgi:hypothetical protein